MKGAYLLLISGLLYNCNKTNHKQTRQQQIIAIQPLSFTDTQQLQLLKTTIETYYHFNVIILPDMGIPGEAYYKPRNRYKADKLIRILKENKADSIDYIIGITAKDISTQKGDIPDFGIMGLGYQPGKSCVVSIFRLKTPNKTLLNERLAKVALHEIGHNLGLPHCTASKDCFMHAAEASIQQIDREKTDMCETCKKNVTG